MEMTRDEMIEVAARANAERQNRSQWGSVDYWIGEAIVNALIAAGVIPDPETTVTVRKPGPDEVVSYMRVGKLEPFIPAEWLTDDDGIDAEDADDPVTYVAIGNGESIPPALQALYESMARNWGDPAMDVYDQDTTTPEDFSPGVS